MAIEATGRDSSGQTVPASEWEWLTRYFPAGYRAEADEDEAGDADCLEVRDAAGGFVFGAIYCHGPNTDNGDAAEGYYEADEGDDWHGPAWHGPLTKAELRDRAKQAAKRCR